MKAWTRWQDWVTLVVGVYAALSPIWSVRSAASVWSLVVLGVLIAVVGLVSLAMPGAVAWEWAGVVLGVLMFLAPWVTGFKDLAGPAWTAWVAGAVTVVVSALALPQLSTRDHAVTAH